MPPILPGSCHMQIPTFRDKILRHSKIRQLWKYEAVAAGTSQSPRRTVLSSSIAFTFTPELCALLILSATANAHCLQGAAIIPQRHETRPKPLLAQNPTTKMNLTSQQVAPPSAEIEDCHLSQPMLRLVQRSPTSQPAKMWVALFGAASDSRHSSPGPQNPLRLLGALFPPRWASSPGQCNLGHWIPHAAQCRWISDFPE